MYLKNISFREKEIIQNKNEMDKEMNFEVENIRIFGRIDKFSLTISQFYLLRL